MKHTRRYKRKKHARHCKTRRGGMFRSLGRQQPHDSDAEDELTFHDAIEGPASLPSKEPEWETLPEQFWEKQAIIERKEVASRDAQHSTDVQRALAFGGPLDPRFTVHDNEGGGNCFFCSVRDAFQDIGRNVTVEHLRDQLSRKVDHDIFQYYRERALWLKDDADARGLTTPMDAQYEPFLRMNRPSDMVNFVKTSQYEGDEWAIAKLEEMYNIKFIVYNTLVKDILCGTMYPFGDQVMIQPPERPSHYIFLWHNGAHYKIIKYNGKSIFTFSTLPEALKMKLLQCFERSVLENDYYSIPDFKTAARSAGYSGGKTRRKKRLLPY